MNALKLKSQLKWFSIFFGVYFAIMFAVGIAAYTYAFGLNWIGLDKEEFKFLLIISCGSASIIYMIIGFLYMIASDLIDASKGAIARLNSARQTR